MGALMKAFWRILLLRAAPQSIPASPVLMWLVLVLHGGVGLLGNLSSGMPLALVAPSALMNTLSMVAVVYGLLRLFGKHARYLQTVTALAACETLLMLLLALLPASLFFILGDVQSGADGVLFVPLSLLFWLLLGWNVALAAHIFRHALEVSRGVGVLYSVVYLIIAVTLGDVAGVAQ